MRPFPELRDLENAEGAQIPKIFDVRKNGEKKLAFT